METGRQKFVLAGLGVGVVALAAIAFLVSRQLGPGAGAAPGNEKTIVADSATGRKLPELNGDPFANSPGGANRAGGSGGQTGIPGGMPGMGSEMPQGFNPSSPGNPSGQSFNPANPGGLQSNPLPGNPQVNQPGRRPGRTNDPSRPSPFAGNFPGGNQDSPIPPFNPAGTGNAGSSGSGNQVISPPAPERPTSMLAPDPNALNNLPPVNSPGSNSGSGTASGGTATGSGATGGSGQNSGSIPPSSIDPNVALINNPQAVKSNTISLKAIVISGEAVAYMDIARQGVRTYRVGSEVAPKTKIVSITADEVVIKKGQKSVTISVGKDGALP